MVKSQISGPGPRWKRGYGRWVRRALVWTEAPLLFRNELLAVDGLAGAARPAKAGEVRPLGTAPVIVPLATDGSERVEIATAGDDRERAFGP